MIATKSAGHMQVGGWISRWSRWPPVCPICPLDLLYVFDAITGHQGKMSRKIRFYCVFSTLGFWTGEFPQHFKKKSSLAKELDLCYPHPPSDVVRSAGPLVFDESDKVLLRVCAA